MKLKLASTEEPTHHQAVPSVENKEDHYQALKPIDESSSDFKQKDTHGVMPSVSSNAGKGHYQEIPQNIEAATNNEPHNLNP